MNKNIKKTILIFGLIVAVALIIVVTIGVSWWLQLWDGYPRGADAVSHLFRVNQILEFWPHFWWFHSWSGGTPHFFWYPSLSYLLIALSYLVTNFSLEFLLSLFGVLSVALAAIAVYLLIYDLTKTYLLGLAGAVIYVATPAVWAADFDMGGYSRGISISFLGLALWACTRWVRALNKGEKAKFAYFLAVLFVGLSFISHYTGGPQTFFAVILLTLFVVPGWVRRLLAVGKIVVPSIFIVSVFLFPLVFLKSPSLSFTAGHESFSYEEMFLPWSSLFYLFTDMNIRGVSSGLFSLAPLLLPLLVVGTSMVLLIRRKALTEDWFLLKIFLAMGFLSLTFIVYGTVYFPFLKHYGSGFFDPRMTVFFLPSFLAPMVVMPFYWLSSHKLIKEAGGLLLIVVAAAWFYIQFPPAGLPRVQSASNALELHLPNLPPETEFNFRFGTGNYSNLAAPFNYRYPYVPQTRDYFATGVVVPDYYTYLVLAGWKWGNNYRETNFLFDWWGVREFAVMNNEEGTEIDLPGKFKSRPDFYSLAGENEPFSVFNYEQASPITSATNVDTVLVLGSEETKAYNLIFRSLAQSDINSQYIIPISGKEYVDDYNRDGLKKFSAILLYDYKFKDAQKAGQLLKEYVETGGGLIIESDKVTESKSKVLTKLIPWPITSIEKADFGKDWNFTVSNYHQEIFSDINFSQFAPAVFDGGPWGVTYASDIKEWAKPVLFDAGKPVLVAGDLGRGRVVWSGMNFPYHIITYNSEEESRLLGKMIAWVQKEEKLEPEAPAQHTQGVGSRPKSLLFDTEKYKVEFVHPEKRIITLKKPAEGILFKEAWFPNWQARVNGAKVQIYKAGPDFMYVPLEQSKPGDEIILTFRTHPVQWLGRLFSLVSLLVLLLYLLDWWIFKEVVSRIPDLLYRKMKAVSSWWDEEEI